MYGKLIEYEGKIATQGAFFDLSDRKKAEDALRESEEKFRTIADNIPMGIFIFQDGKLQYVGREAVRLLGYDVSDVIIGRSFMDFVHPDERAHAADTASRRIASKTVQDYTETRLLRKDGSVLHALVYGNLIEYRGKVATQGAFFDITDRKEAEQEIKRGYEQLLETFISTINALASMVEMKDPYTAGHQRLTTRLACTIAEEMGLREEQIEGIRMAGLIHDIGKINIPAEILSKPGHLSEIQYSMVKIHPEVGYDILREIKFPWPVAQIVLQHHERFDGSGYPQGLSGDAIMLEARIMAVADSVEAMSSHRPYRAAPGTEKALKEIATNRGALYDPQVVDACLKIFEKGFQLD